MHRHLQRFWPAIAVGIFLAFAVSGGIWDGSSDQKRGTAYQPQSERPEQAIAWYTEELAYFTAILAVATIGLGIGTFFQIKLARAEFVATQRPRIRVRNVTIKPANESLVSRLGFFQPNQLLTGQLYVSNVGGTPATITASHCIVYWSSALLPMRRPYEGKNPNGAVPLVKLAPGQSHVGIFQSDEPIGKDWGV